MESGKSLILYFGLFDGDCCFGCWFRWFEAKAGFEALALYCCFGGVGGLFFRWIQVYVCIHEQNDLAVSDLECGGVNQIPVSVGFRARRKGIADQSVID